MSEIHDRIKQIQEQKQSLSGEERKRIEAELTRLLVKLTVTKYE
jgi:hypothetical protein